MKSEDSTPVPPIPARTKPDSMADETRAFRLSDLLQDGRPKDARPPAAEVAGHAIKESSALQDDGVTLLDSVRRIVDSFKRKDDFREISTQAINGILENLGAEYSSLVLFPTSDDGDSSLCIEGIRERGKFLRIHTGKTLLGGGSFEMTAVRVAVELGGALSIDDVRVEPRFNHLTLPGMARALVCLPILAQRVAVGGLIATHSQPGFFRGGRALAMRVLAAVLNHSNHLLAARSFERIGAPEPSKTGISVGSRSQDVCSLILFDFEQAGNFAHIPSFAEEVLPSLRNCLRQGLDARESLIVQGKYGLLALLPGVPSAQLPQRVRILQDLFFRWRGNQKDSLRRIRVRMGFSTCEEGQDLARTLDLASRVMNPESMEEYSLRY